MEFTKFKPFVKELIAYYYKMPEKGAGGCLHVFLDDGNIDFGSLNFCQNECEKYGDTFGYFLCDILSEFSEEGLEEMYNDNWWGMES